MTLAVATSVADMGIHATYIRESSGEAGNEVEMQGQRRTCRALAERNGVDPDVLVEYNDWGHSGSDSDRPGLARLRGDIIAGRVSVIYARSVDRLGRVIQEGIEFEDLARLHGVRVVTERDGERTIDPVMVNTFQRYMPHLVAQEESRLGKLRAKEGRRTRLANIAAHRESCSDAHCQDPQHYDGVMPYGTRPGEDWERVLVAFHMSGDYAGAARILNGWGVQSRGGKANAWTGTTVARIVRREAPEMVPPRQKRGARAMSVNVFSRLLSCPHDHAVMTATKRGKGTPVYFCPEPRKMDNLCPTHGLTLTLRDDWKWSCPEGHTVGRWATRIDHPRPWTVSEPVVMEWARHEVGGMGTFVASTAEDEEVDRQVAALDVRIERLNVMVELETITVAQFRERVAEVRSEQERLSGSRRASVSLRMGVDFHATSAEVNARLREVWHEVRLSPDMQPTGAVWRVQPMIDDPESDTGGQMPHPAAEKTIGGWYLPSASWRDSSPVDAPGRTRRRTRRRTGAAGQSGGRAADI